MLTLHHSEFCHRDPRITTRRLTNAGFIGTQEKTAMNTEQFLYRVILFRVLLYIQPKTKIQGQVVYLGVNSRSRTKGAERGSEGRRKKTNVRYVIDTTIVGYRDSVEKYMEFLSELSN